MIELTTTDLIICHKKLCQKCLIVSSFKAPAHKFVLFQVVRTVQQPHNSEKYLTYKKIAQEAYANRKIFVVYDLFYGIRNGLLQRGWVEWLPSGTHETYRQMTDEALLLKAEKGNIYEKVLLSRMVEIYPPFFVWLWESNERNLHMNAKIVPKRNVILRGRDFNFSTKLGFIGCAETVHWFTDAEQSELKCPRFHRLTSDEQQKFLEDYRITECFNLLSFLDDKGDDDLNPVYSLDGEVPSSIIKFALDRVAELLIKSTHKDIDEPRLGKTDEEWNHFIANSRLITNNSSFKCDKLDFDNYRALVKKALKAALPYWPTIKMDGYRNLWIMKPGESSRGQGIVIFKKYEEIIGHATQYPESKYMVQKYMERPFLIYKTKFDIRQWMLVTLNGEVNIWMYKECYLRFSSQEYTLDSFSNAIHVTNYAVQKNCKNGIRSPKLPEDNMWSSTQFSEFLNNNGYGDVWSSVYEGMKKCFLAIFQASLIDTEIHRNCFELYGCDFMVNEQLEPYLLEVNSYPDMSYSSVVTTRMCAQVVQDVLKVVVDLPENPEAETGDFELVFSTPVTSLSTSIAGLLVNGVSMNICHGNLPKAGSGFWSLKNKVIKKDNQSTQVPLLETDENFNVI